VQQKRAYRELRDRIGVQTTIDTEENNMPYKHLTRKERGKIALFRNQRLSVREIALRLGRCPATISRELKRNTGERYRADDAEKKYRKRRENSRRGRLYENEGIRDYVSEKLLLCWSPEQIAGRMRLEDKRERASCSSIYR
jgi:IS30 family transposase